MKTSSWYERTKSSLTVDSHIFIRLTSPFKAIPECSGVTGYTLYHKGKIVIMDNNGTQIPF